MVLLGPTDWALTGRLEPGDDALEVVGVSTGQPFGTGRVCTADRIEADGTLLFEMTTAKTVHED